MALPQLEENKMSSNYVVISGTVVDPLDAGTLGAEALVVTLPVQMTLVYASFSPSTDDAGLTVDIQDDGTDTAAVAIAAADQNVPGEWKSTHVGGTNAPIAFAADSDLSLDVNSAAAATALHYQLYFLPGVA